MGGKIKALPHPKEKNQVDYSKKISDYTSTKYSPDGKSKIEYFNWENLQPLGNEKPIAPLTLF